MKALFSPRTLFLCGILGVVCLSAACRAPAPTSTPVPPTVNMPTALPPAPTAPPLTEAPTAVLPTQAPPTATAVIPTQPPPTPTVIVPTNAPSPVPTNTTSSGVATPIKPPTPTSASGSAVVEPTVDRGPLTGLYIAGLRFEPDYPRRNDPVMFYATLVNRTGREQYYPVCAEIFRPDAKKSFGITNCDNLTIPVGTNEIFIGSWTGTGIKECIPVRARAVLREQGEGEVRWVFTTTNGGELWTDFQICP